MMARTAPRLLAHLMVGSLALLGAGGRALAQDAGPTYASSETERVVAAMLEAHGGLERWRRAPAFDYTIVMYLASLPVGGELERSWLDNWRYYRAVVDPRTSQGFVELPIEAGTGPFVGFDGTSLWNRAYGFDIEQFRDGPTLLLYFHYSMINLPWMTQMDDVDLRLIDPARLPGRAIDYTVIEMTFSPDDATHEGYFHLYVDPVTHRLAGWVATTPLPRIPGGVLPGQLGGGGPADIFRIIDEHMEIDGLLVPRSYASLRVADGATQLLGAHLVVDASFRGDLDRSRLVPPDDANVRAVGGREEGAEDPS